MKLHTKTLTATACLIAAGAIPASAEPTFTTVALDDFEVSAQYPRWQAQLSSQGHVVYFAENELRRWSPAGVETLHQHGTHLDGLAPGVTTIALPPNTPHRWGRILGVDAEGGVSMLLYDSVNENRLQPLLASTLPGGGVGAIMARPEIAAPIGVVRSTVSDPTLGAMRSDDGFTLARGIPEDGTRTIRVFSPSIEDTVVMEEGQRTPSDDGEVYFSHFYSTVYSSLQAVHVDIAPGGSTANYFHFILDNAGAGRTGVARRVGGETSVILRTDTYIDGLSTTLLAKPIVRINRRGDTLIYTMFSFEKSQPVSSADALILYPIDGPPEYLFHKGGTIELANHPPISTSWFSGPNRLVYLGDDGSVIYLAVDAFSPETGLSLLHRSPTGETNMLLTDNPDVLGVPGASVSYPATLEPLFASADASSAAAIYHVNAAMVLFYATPASVTPLIQTGDSLEVAPGDVRRVLRMRLLDVNGPRVLFAADFQGGSKGMILADIPGCPADLNNDGVVDADDFFLFLQWFADADPRADINNDGVIDADDFFEYLTLFAQGC